MNHEHIIERLEREPFTSLDRDQADALRRQAGDCVTCRDALEAAELAGELLRGRSEVVAVPSAFFEARLKTRLRGTARPGPAARLIGIFAYGHFRWKYATLVVSLLVFGLTASLWSGLWPESDEAPQPLEVSRTQPEEYDAPDDDDIQTDPGAVATEFYPLTWMPESTEGGQLVRVMVTRSALQTLGIPLDPSLDRTGWEDQIEAEVIIGDDGLARAIRFIH